MGSGTTAIACINKNRQYIGFELNPTYIDMSKNRIKQYTIKEFF
jgi:site-specific DNA-methyltransferase (adenine-specific)